MSESQLYRVSVIKYDGCLRYTVPSRRKGVAPYLVELDAYRGNGMCVCKHFQTRLEPLIKRGITPAAAVDGGFVKVPPWGTVEDALRCFHIHAARLKFADDFIKAVHDDLEKKSSQAGRPA